MQDKVKALEEREAMQSDASKSADDKQEEAKDTVAAGTAAAAMHDGSEDSGLEDDLQVLLLMRSTNARPSLPALLRTPFYPCLACPSHACPKVATHAALAHACPKAVPHAALAQASLKAIPHAVLAHTCPKSGTSCILGPRPSPSQITITSSCPLACCLQICFF
eukprot:355359-Chlamydomonas_euryale.AAC.19